jgi:RimJ/RimL family protein N-acetyltransferase
MERERSIHPPAAPAAGRPALPPLPPLAGRRVRLRALRGEDASALAAAAAGPRDSYGHTVVPDGDASAAAYVARALAQQRNGQRWPLAVEFEGRLVGSTSFYEPERWDWPAGSRLQPGALDAVKIGHTWLAASAQRTGCNTEAKWLMLQQAFEGWGVQRVALCTDARNLRSRQAIERLGVPFEGVLRAQMPAVDGGLRDTAVFAATAADWPGLRAHLCTLLPDMDAGSGTAA